MVDLNRASLERYISLWTYAKQSGALTSKEKVLFDVSPEIWPFFCIEMTGILIQRRLLELFTLASGGVGSNTPPHLYFQYAWLGMVLKMVVNNFLLRWTIHEGNMDGIRLWSWLKVRYESMAKLDPLRGF